MKAITFNLLAWVMLPIMDGLQNLSADLPVLQITWADIFLLLHLLFQLCFSFSRKKSCMDR